MKLEDFDFALPEELIALRPAAKRDFSRLLVANPNDQTLADLQFKDLPNQLRNGDVLVFNNSRTIAANLCGIRKARDENSNDVSININLHKRHNDNSWWAFVKPAKRLKIGDKIMIADNFFALLKLKNEGGDVLLEFSQSNNELADLIDIFGKMPIPPYIGLKRDVDAQDAIDYQTIYASKKGSVATPTAGLHFSQEINERLDEIGVKRCFVTLHVGAGTFLPVKTEDIISHKMHSEYFEIPIETAEIINQAKREGRRVICVGTTSLRTIESSLDENEMVIAQARETNIFLYPSKKIKSADGLITNFHLPKSTLLMLLSAFCGREFVMNSYEHAILKKYRFFSYGDCGLWWKKNGI